MEPNGLGGEDEICNEPNDRERPKEKQTLFLLVLPSSVQRTRSSWLGERYKSLRDGSFRRSLL